MLRCLFGRRRLHPGNLPIEGTFSYLERDRDGRLWITFYTYGS